MGEVIYLDEHHIDSTWVVYGVRLVGRDIRYIGLTTQGPTRRFFYNHKRKAYLENQDGVFYDWLRKYSIEDFEVVVLSVCFKEDYNSLNLLEQYWIDYYRNINGDLKNRKTNSYLLNVADGGLGHVYSGEDHWNYGKLRPQSTREKISLTRKERNISPWNKGKSLPNISGQNNPYYGKQHSDEVREKMSKSSHNRWHESKGIYKESCRWCGEVDKTS